MAEEALLPCIVCGKTLRNAGASSDNQPSEGTEFSTYGHYGSTFWDSFDGELLVLNVCDPCLTKYKKRLGRHKRYRNITSGGTTVGRQWIRREIVPYFDGPEDFDSIDINPEEILNLPGYDNVEWTRTAADTKEYLIATYAREDEELDDGDKA